MSDQVLVAIITVAGVLTGICLIGGMINFAIWRDQTGRNALESERRKIEARKAWASANEQLNGRCE